MKKLYILPIFLFLLLCKATYSQPTSYERNARQPENSLAKQATLPFIGFQVAVPLSNHFKNKQKEKLEKLQQALNKPLGYQQASGKPSGPPSDRPPLDSPTTSNDDGSYAWETTGPEITIYVPRASAVGGGAPGYTWDGGAWSYTYNESVPADNGSGFGQTYEEPPIPVKVAKKVRRDHCENGKTIFKSMYDAQQARDKEQAAFITDKGIFWMSDSDNMHDFFVVGAASEYPQHPDGTRYFIANGEEVRILGIIHTHPSTPPNNGPGLSGSDLAISNGFNVPIYAIHNSGIWKGTPNGNVSRISHNMSDAFDCAVAPGLIGY